MTAVFCSVAERYVNPLFEVFDGGDFVLTSWRDVESAETEMDIFLADAKDVPAAMEALAGAGRIVGVALDIKMRSFPDEDWKLAYRRHFKTDFISARLAVVPTWEMDAWQARSEVLSDVKVVTLDPGMAFGTGQHATTHACLEYVDALALENSARSFLDVGCGSGILAIAASKLGFREVAGFDVDPDAVKVANEMAALNGLNPFFVRGDLCNVSTLPGMARMDKAYDVVVANVLGPVLIRFAKEIAPLVAKQGMLVLSGILDELYDDVRSAYEALGFAETSSKLVGEWRTGLFARVTSNV